MASHHTPQVHLTLSAHARACALGRQVVLLDLHRSRYVGIPRLAGLEQCIQGWPQGDETSIVPSTSSERQRMTERLHSTGLLVQTEDPEQPWPAFFAPSRSLDALDATTAGPIGLEARYRMLSSMIDAYVSLRTRSLFTIVGDIHQRKASAQRGPDRNRQGDLTSLVASYERLRPTFFTVKDHCLFDSLALLFFLVRYGHQPTLVVGVTTRPFSAHAWLQCGAVVLNDQRDAIVRFKQILSI